MGTHNEGAGMTFALVILSGLLVMPLVNTAVAALTRKV